MPVYALIRHDNPGVKALRAEHRDAHIAFLRSTTLNIRLGGLMLDEAGETAGSLLVVEAESAAEIEAFVAADPYTGLGVFGSVVIRQWRIATGTLA